MPPRAILLAMLAACGSDQKPHMPAPPADAAPSRPVVGVELEISPAQALVSIDEVDRGPAAELAKVISLEPGLHRLIVTFDVESEVNIDQVNAQNRVSQAQPNLPTDVNQFGLTYRSTVGLPLVVISLY